MIGCVQGGGYYGGYEGYGGYGGYEGLGAYGGNEIGLEDAGHKEEEYIDYHVRRNCCNNECVGLKMPEKYSGRSV